jgi:hypothetical protein
MYVLNAVLIQVSINDLQKSKMLNKFIALKMFCSRSGGFSCSLYVLHGGLGINILQFFFINKSKLFSTVKMSLFSKSWIRIETNANPHTTLMKCAWQHGAYFTFVLFWFRVIVTYSWLKGDVQPDYILLTLVHKS